MAATPERPQSTTVIWLVCTGIGLLFLARGAFQPYVFPIFEHLGGLSYAQIALLVNGYLMTRAERSLRGDAEAGAGGWRRLRRTSIASLALWFIVLLLGTVLPNVGSGPAA